MRHSQAQIARLLGVSRQAVSLHVKSGRLPVDENGNIDIEDARLLSETMPPSAKTAGALKAQKPISNQTTSEQPKSESPQFSYHVVKTMREAEEARMARLKREEMEGQLIRLEAVRSVAANTLAATREALLQLPARLSTVLAAEGSPARVHDLLQQEIQQALAQLATLPDRVGADARQEATTA